MIDRFIDPASLFQRTDNGTRSMAWIFAVSAVGHLVFFLILIFIPTQLPAKRYTPSVINVRMVSLPGADLAGRPGPRVVVPKPEKPKEPPRPAEVKPDQPKPVQVSKPEPPKAEVTIPKTPEKEVTPVPLNPVESLPPDTISVAPKKKTVKNKTSLKKKTFQSAQVIKKAIKRIEKKTEVSRPNTVKQAIDRLRSEVKKTEVDQVKKKAESDDVKETADGGGIGIQGDGSGIPGQPGAMSRQVLEKIDLYKLEIAYHIEKKWAFPEQFAGGRTDLEAVLVIKILPNGEIRDIWFEKKSGNSYFDESAFRAVRKSNPLPPLPKEFRRPFYNVGLVFTPSGLRKGRG
jgi:colicin import membrane protein